MIKLNYHHLKYFHAIALHGSIASAARVLHITPQTLSAQLTNLEQQLGCALFERKGKRLVLNEKGKTAFSYASEIFGLGDELIDSLKQKANDFSLTFTIGVTDVIAKVFSFNFLKEIYAMNESVKLICKETSLPVLLGELANNKLDAILSDTSLPLGSSVKGYSHLVGKSGFSFFAEQSLCQQLKADFPYSMDGQHYFIAGEGTNQKHSVLSWFKQLNINPVIIGEFDDSILAKYFSEAGYGVICAPTIIERSVMQQFKVNLIGRTQEIEEYYYLITPERKVKHPAVKHLLQASKALFNE